MPTSVPQAPPRSKKPPLTKNDISAPYDFQHVSHVGLDFKSEDVRNAIKPRLSPGRQQSTQSDNLYEAVQRQETPILMAASPKEEMAPPAEFAPEYVSSAGKTGPTPNEPLNTVPPAPLTSTDVSDYENRPTPHIYQNIEIIKNRPRPSKKKHPPPPPPQADKPKLSIPEEEAPSVAFRTQTSVPKVEAAEVPVVNGTPQRIEVGPASVIIERPGMLGEMRLGLDDPIPLMTGIPSKYRTPSMLTPKEMAVDVPTPLRSPEQASSPKKDEAPRPPLVKEVAVDVPPTPSAGQTSFPAEPPVDHKRRAPSPPSEPDAPARGYQPYQPVGVAKVPPQMKNVISELKTRQSKEEPTEEDMAEHEYVSFSQYKRISVEEPRSPRILEKGEKVEKFPVVQESTESQISQDEPEKPAPIAPKEPVKPVPIAPKEPVKTAGKQSAFEEKEPTVISEAPSQKTKEKAPLQEPKNAPETKNPVKAPVAPVPVPRPRKTAPSVDVKEEEEPLKTAEPIKPAAVMEERTPETRHEDSSAHDDGIDTGCSDDDLEVIRL